MNQSDSANLYHFLFILRLILPYERFTKGEEDKPLPPAKHRKPEGSAQEGIVKTKMTATKQTKDEQKPWSEKDASAKVPELVSLSLCPCSLFRSNTLIYSAKHINSRIVFH